jgi:hypothetical protein
VSGDLPPILDVGRLHLEPGDVVVVHVAGNVTAEQGERIRVAVEELITPHRALVVSDTITISVLEVGA